MSEVQKKLAALKGQIQAIENRMSGDTFTDEQTVASLAGNLPVSAAAVADAILSAVGFDSVLSALDDAYGGDEDE